MSPKIIHTEWNLKPLFENDNDPKIEAEKKILFKKIEEFKNKWKPRKDYLEKPEVLKEALDDYEKICEKYGTSGTIGYYFWLRHSQDQSNPEIKAKYNQIDELSKKLSNEISFFSLNIAKIPEEKQKKFLEYSGLKDYKHYLETSFASAKYLLSEAEEKIMALKSGPAHENWVKMTSELLSSEEREVLNEEGKKEIKNFNEIIGLTSSTKKEVRDFAAEKVNEILKENLKIAELEMNSILQDKKINDGLRGFETPDKARHISDDIDSEVVWALVKAVSERYDISKRFYELKAKLMKVPKLAYHERNVPYGKLDKKYSYQEAIDLVHSVFESLDKKFSKILEEFIKNGQIDAFPKKGKVGGAFCTNGLKIHPVYVLLNYNNRINDVITIAHELGHAINYELIREKQNSLNFETSISTAEVASTFMEDFVVQKLIKEAEPELKLALLMEKMGQDINSIQRQIAFYKFELDLHNNFREKGYLSKEEIGKLFQKHMQSYMGDYVSQDPGSENWWVYVWHFRRFFYVYSYASGLLISKAMQSKVKQNHSFIEKVKEFLSAGTSDSPKNIFAKMNIDITKKEFWDLGLKELDSVLKETEALAKQLGKI